jgi:hypothetical protein
MTDVDFNKMNVFAKTKKMRVKDFLYTYNIDLKEFNDDIKTSWHRFERGRTRSRDKVKVYDRWFNENKDWIRPIISEFAKKKYGVEIIG